MHDLYTFDFLNTVSDQLYSRLKELEVTVLNTESLETLTEFQGSVRSMQGVYVIHYDGKPVYVGKADKMSQRLAKHLGKLVGRQNIDRSKIGYKCLLLEKSMGTAASEEILIKLFASEFPGMWNGAGFGTNDPGKQRDTTKPGPFDQAYPIIADYPLIGIKDEETIGSLSTKLKEQLPYLFRHNIGKRTEIVDLTSVSRTAPALIQALVNSLGDGWRAGQLSYGFVLYKNTMDYSVYGKNILPDLSE